MNLATLMRPKTFEEVIGNEHIVKPLKTQLEKGELSQTLLISGPSGAGKTTLAYLIVNYLNAELNEIDCGSAGTVDNMRQIVDHASVSSVFFDKKVFILDEAHVLTVPAQRALLKTLEESRPGTHFILLTTDPGKLIEPIYNRCARYTVRAATREQIGIAVNRALDKSGLSVENRADFWSLIESSNGSLRNVYSMMETLIASAEDGVIPSSAFKALIGTSSTEIDENIPRVFLSGNQIECLSLIKKIRKDNQPYPTMLGIYNYLKAVHINGTSVNAPMMVDLSIMLAHKDVTWEHLEHVVWKHLGDKAV